MCLRSTYSATAESLPSLRVYGKWAFKHSNTTVLLPWHMCVASGPLISRVLWSRAPTDGYPLLISSQVACGAGQGAG